MKGELFSGYGRIGRLIVVSSVPPVQIRWVDFTKSEGAAFVCRRNSGACDGICDRIIRR